MEGEYFMHRISYLLLICILLILASQAGASAAESEPAPESQAALAVNSFAIDVYRQLAAERGNIFFSPYSILSALAMTYAGASGDTAAEMASTLHFSGSIHSSMNSLRERFDSIPADAGTFSVANRLWLDKREKLAPAYAATIESNYGADVGTADFLNDHESVRLEINDWVAQKTRDKIKDLMQKGDVASETILVLVNAVYFNSAWRMPFEKSATREEAFRTGKDEQRNVPMMRQTSNFLYGENEDAQWIRIPYTIPGFFLTIFLPRENESFTQLAEFESKLTVEALISWMADTQHCEVSLSMPKFKDERRYPLAELLQKLGMNLAFGEGADFSGLVEKRNDSRAIHIDSVIHQAFIELDEERTEAAAATAVGIRALAMPIMDEPIIFHADHPFIYCLTDNSGTILFIGRMNEPEM
jgi:serpin B